MNQRIQKFLNYVLPNLGNLLWMTTFFIFLRFGRLIMNQGGDLLLHLNLGKYILDNGKIPLRDLFSHTMNGQPVIQHEWLSGVIFELIVRFIGFKGVVLLSALLISTTFWLVYKTTREKSQFLITAFLVSFLSMITSIIHWHTRPHIFTFLLLAIWMILLDQLRDGNLKRWWLLPVVMLFWVNLHGGFIAGFLTWFIYGFGLGFDNIFNKENLQFNFWRYYLLGGISSLFVTLLNPSGLGTWKMVASHLSNKYLADTTVEFQSPNFHQEITWPFLLFVGLLVIVTGLSRKKTRSELLFGSTAWLALSLYSARYIPLFAIISAPLLVKGMDDLFVDGADHLIFLNRLKKIDKALNHIDLQINGKIWPIISILIVIIALELGFKLDFGGHGYEIDSDKFPVDAVNWLHENPQPGNMFNFFIWGGYLEYNLWPEELVFVDTKQDFYGEAFMHQYRKVFYVEEGWEEVLDQYDVSWAILPTDERVAKAIQADLGWVPIYQDDTAIILRDH
jgi:hypothetical protein